MTTLDLLKATGGYVCVGAAGWWHRSAQLPDDGTRVLTFSSVYGEQDPMRFRIMDGQFVAKCQEVEWWADCDQLLPGRIQRANDNRPTD